MAGLPWIPLDVGFPKGPKAIALGVALQDKRAWSHVVQIWTEAAQHAADGHVNGPAAVQILEDWACWNGSPGALVEALCLPHIRLLDATDSGFYIHDWAQHCGAHVEKREKDRKRMKRVRAAKRARTVREPNADVRGETETETEKETEKETTRVGRAPRPLAVHLQAQCPSLADLLSRTAWVDPGRKAALWGEAEALVNQVGPEAALACWTSAAAKRQGDPDDVPLAYLIHPLRALAKRPAPKPPEPPPSMPDPGCPEWAEARERVKARLRPDLWERWFLPLTGRMDGDVLVLTAPDDFHAEFMADNHRAFLEEEARRPVRLEARATEAA